MNTNKIIVAGLLGSVLAFILGWIIWGMLLSGVMGNYAGTASGVMRGQDEMLWFPLVIGHLGLGFLLAIIYGRWAAISTFNTGAKAGSAIGFLVAFANNMIMLGTTHIMQPTGAIIDIIASAISMGFIGGFIGWWLGRGK
jgi:hypothetical protein